MQGNLARAVRCTVVPHVAIFFVLQLVSATFVCRHVGFPKVYKELPSSFCMLLHERMSGSTFVLKYNRKRESFNRVERGAPLRPAVASYCSILSCHTYSVASSVLSRECAVEAGVTFPILPTSYYPLFIVVSHLPCEAFFVVILSS